MSPVARRPSPVARRPSPVARLLNKTGAALVVAATLALLPGAAAAADKVLLLTTAETTLVGTTIMQRLLDAYQGAAGAGNVIDRRGALTNASLAAADFNGADIVVVASANEAIAAANMTLITSLMNTRPDLHFVMFVDSCCHRPQNIDPIVSRLNAATGWSLSLTYTSGPTTSPLNTNSPYRTSFASLTSITGFNYATINNTPGAYALYLPQGATPPAPTASAGAFGLFVPQKRVNAGQGSCTWFFVDASPFFNTPSAADRQAIAAASLTSVRNTSGSCKAETIEPDLTPELGGPAYAPPAGAAASYSLTVKNIGLSASTDGIAEVELPAGMLPVTGTYPASCTWAAPKLTCTLPGIAASSAAPVITFQARNSNPAPYTLKSSVRNVTGETNTANNHAGTAPTGAPRANLTLGGQPTPVPANAPWALAALAALMALSAQRRRA